MDHYRNSVHEISTILLRQAIDDNQHTHLTPALNFMYLQSHIQEAFYQEHLLELLQYHHPYVINRQKFQADVAQVTGVKIWVMALSLHNLQVTITYANQNWC